MSKEFRIEIPDSVKTDEFVALVRAVNSDNPTKKDVEGLQQYFADNPHTANALGNLVYLVQGNLIRHSFDLPSLRQAIVAKLGQMRDDMGYSQAGAIERSLIEHVILCWLRLYDTELRYSQAMQDNPTFARGKYWEQKLAANQRRYLRSVESLERVRKLMHRSESSAMKILLKQQVGNW